ncbi:amidohydrolase family protein [Streptomyces hokutonensis]|uniref:amidohydrolase family protein n=1 Tax=Streptomyces hokutonensis TaxID=1306990 RepID=UPI0036C23B0F
MQQPSVERGLRAVQDRDLGYDVLIRSHQFPQAIRLAQRFPGLPLVLDHAGKRPIGQPRCPTGRAMCTRWPATLRCGARSRG